MRKTSILTAVFIILCNCSFCQDDDSFAGVSYSFTPASHPVYNEDTRFEKSKIKSQEFNFFLNYGDSLNKKSLWFASFNYGSIKSKNELDDSILYKLDEKTPLIFTDLPKEKIYSLAVGIQYSINKAHSLVYYNSFVVTDIIADNSHTKSINVDAMLYANKNFSNKNTFGLGCYINTDFKEITAFPVLAATVNYKRWELTSSLPLQFNANYQLTDRFALGVGSNLDIYYFNINEKGKEQPANLTHTNLQITANIEYKIKPLVFYSKLGYAYQEYIYNSANNYQFSLPESPYFEIGIMLNDY